MKTVIFFALSLVIIFSNGCKNDATTEPSNQQNTITDIDGNVYNTVKIGNQVWMVENLKVTKYRNGEPIPNVTEDAEWANFGEQEIGAYCNYDNSFGSANTFGRLYNYYAVIDSRNIAPSGWHIPSADEWKTLIDYLGSASVVGGNLKEAGTTHWKSPNEGADNSSGFTALPGGQRYWNPDNFYPVRFYDIGEDGYWWSTSSSGNWSCVSLNYDSRAISKPYATRPAGFSVRCVKD